MLQFADRSQLAKTFTYDRDVGLLLFGKFDIKGILVKPYYMFTTGEGRSLIDIQYNTGNQHVVRLEVLTGGEFKSFDGFIESDLDREGHPKGSFSIGYEINNGPVRQRGNSGPFILTSPGPTIDGQIRTLLIDGMFKYKGFSTLFEYLDREVDVPIFLSGNGFNWQVGYLTKSNFEIGLRHSSLKIDGMEDAMTEQRIVFNRYFRNHDLKILLELGKVNSALNNDVVTFRFMTTVFL